MMHFAFVKRWLVLLVAAVICVAVVPVNSVAAGIGDYITFGSYEQDNDFFNGKEPIEWLIIKSSGSEVLLMSRYALDCQPYNTSSKSITWQDCTLRRWLNSDFYNAAFSSKEKAAIVQKSAYNTVGNMTTDAVFLMSCDEGLTWFNNNAARTATATEYAQAQGVPDLGGGKCWYWLRDRGAAPHCACYVNSSGLTCGKPNGMVIENRYGAVRPMIWVSIDALVR